MRVFNSSPRCVPPHACHDFPKLPPNLEFKMNQRCILCFLLGVLFVTGARAQQADRAPAAGQNLLRIGSRWTGTEMESLATMKQRG